MVMRILLFEDQDDTRQLLCTYLRGLGHEVLDFRTPVTCALVAEEHCTCPRNQACADVIITDMNMPEMSGLELIRYQAAKGCHAPAHNKAVISAALPPELQLEFQSLGCHCLKKPFKLRELAAWVADCARHVPPDRTLTAPQELWRTAQIRPS